MKKALLLALVIVCSAPLFAQKAPPTTPAARNWLQGLNSRKEKFDRLTAKLKKGAQGQGPNAQVPRSLFCPMALESALATALIDAHLVTGKNEDFHLLFDAPSKEQYLDVSYTYNPRGVLLLAGIHKLPDGWRVGIQPGEINAGKFIVLTDELTRCIFEFDAADPFASRATVADDN